MHNYDAGAYVASVASSLGHNNYDAGAYVASVASNLVHDMTLELSSIKPVHNMML